ncbi:hypothetical protein BHE74_00024034 [Ensete ventricosum]|nr:hypothetical protein BHE74_00024034 [Ensete ventricosum]
MQARRELNDPENAIIGAFAEEREKKKKREKKNLESGAALRPRDPSPADDFFSLPVCLCVPFGTRVPYRTELSSVRQFGEPCSKLLVLVRYILVVKCFV